MRIRKHYSKVLGMASSQQRSSPPQTTVVDLSEAAWMIQQGLSCQVNRSRWDVSPYPPLGEASDKEEERVIRDDDNEIMEREEEEAVISAITSRSSSNNINAGLELIEEEEEPADSTDYESDEEYTLERKQKKMKKANIANKGKTVKEESKHTESSTTATATYTCKKTDGKQWRCKEPVDKPNSLCNHHRDQLLFYRCTRNTNRKVKRSAPERKTPARSRKRPRQKRPRSAITSAGLDMYYYSAFGPWRGKQRGSEPAAVSAATKEESQEEQLERCDDEYDDNDDDDNEDSPEEECSEEESSSKKNRRPVKARSLNLL